MLGTKGQVVIAKEIRDQLGVEPGWLAVQRLVEDHVEIYLLPPEHRDSLKGSLAEYINAHIAHCQDWDAARHTAWERSAKEAAGALEQVS